MEISSNDLVPGDVIEISRAHWILPCDAVLLSGGCVMNESGLTGESMPVLKTACADTADNYDAEHGGVRHTIFAGTSVLQINPDKSGKVFAIVSATSTATSKGQLISSILYPETVLFRYEEELEAVICLLLLYGFVAFGMSMYLQSTNGTSSTFITMWAYGVFTCSQIFSPLLPVALKVGQIRSSERLLNKDVFCVNPRRIAISGKVNVFCFDKTGTLTNDGMEFSGISFTVPKARGSAGAAVVMSELRKDVATDLSIPAILLDCLASCHSLSTYGNNEFVGNDVEVKMFTATGWSLRNIPNSDASEVRSPDNKRAITVHRKFEFDHAKQTMSVIVEDKTWPRPVVSFCKGSFEKIAALCSADSVPSDFVAKARQFALNGGYVLGLAYRQLDDDTLSKVSSIHRDEIEVAGSFTLLGMLIFRNEPKADSRAAILEIRAGSVRPVMITGDNAQCGQYIAKTCALIDESSVVVLGEFDHSTNTVMWAQMTATDPDKPIKVMTCEQVLTEMSKTRRYHDEPPRFYTDSDPAVEYAISGNATVEYLDRMNMLDAMLPQSRIFARTSPHSKALVVNRFRALGFIVGMCGDGGNDCGALRAAHAGIALSDAEASVVSPFTSKSKSIFSVVDLLKEGLNLCTHET